MSFKTTQIVERMNSLYRHALDQCGTANVKAVSGLTPGSTIEDLRFNPIPAAELAKRIAHMDKTAHSPEVRCAATWFAAENFGATTNWENFDSIVEGTVIMRIAQKQE